MIESADGKGRRWSTIGVSPNIVDASYNALYDAITYKLFRDGAEPATGGTVGSTVASAEPAMPHR
jgi:2-isopropylmalate synthase